jgi:hypothetical protein
LDVSPLCSTKWLKSSLGIRTGTTPQQVDGNSLNLKKR